MKDLYYKQVTAHLNRKYAKAILFFRGRLKNEVGTVFNFWGNYYNRSISQNTWQADLKSLNADWCITGRDMESAVKSKPKQIATSDAY